MAQKQLQLSREIVDSLIANPGRRIGENRERRQRQELLSIIHIVLDLLDEDDFDNNGFEDKTRQYE